MKKILWSIIILTLTLFLFGCEEDDKSYLLSEDFKEEMLRYDKNLDELTDVYLSNDILDGDLDKLEEDIMNIILLANEFKEFESEDMTSFEKEVYDALNELILYTVMTTKPTIDAMYGNKVDTEQHKKVLKEYEKLYKNKQRIFEFYDIN